MRKDRGFTVLYLTIALCIVTFSTGVKADNFHNKVIKDCLNSSFDTPKVFTVRDWLGLGCMIDAGRAPRGAFPNRTSGEALSFCGISESRCRAFADAVEKLGGVELMQEFILKGTSSDSNKLLRIGRDAANIAYGN